MRKTTGHFPLYWHGDLCDKRWAAPRQSRHTCRPVAAQPLHPDHQEANNATHGAAECRCLIKADLRIDLHEATGKAEERQSKRKRPNNKGREGLAGESRALTQRNGLLSGRKARATSAEIFSGATSACSTRVARPGCLSPASEGLLCTRTCLPPRTRDT